MLPVLLCAFLALDTVATPSLASLVGRQRARQRPSARRTLPRCLESRAGVPPPDATTGMTVEHDTSNQPIRPLRRAYFRGAGHVRGRKTADSSRPVPRLAQCSRLSPRRGRARKMETPGPLKLSAVSDGETLRTASGQFSTPLHGAPIPEREEKHGQTPSSILDVKLDEARLPAELRPLVTSEASFPQTNSCASAPLKGDVPPQDVQGKGDDLPVSSAGTSVPDNRPHPPQGIRSCGACVSSAAPSTPRSAPGESVPSTVATLPSYNTAGAALSYDIISRSSDDSAGSVQVGPTDADPTGSRRRTSDECTSELLDALGNPKLLDIAEIDSIELVQGESTLAATYKVLPLARAPVRVGLSPILDWSLQWPLPLDDD